MASDEQTDDTTDRLMKEIETALGKLQAREGFQRKLNVEQTIRLTRISGDLYVYAVVNGPVGGSSPYPGTKSPGTGGVSVATKGPFKMTCPNSVCGYTLTISVT
jgi:hypothetical protein